MAERVLVTGAGGYIGRHVVDELLLRGCEVLAADLRLDGVDERAIPVTQPIFERRDDLVKALGSPSRVIHLAWRNGFNHNASSHIDDLPAHVAFVEALMRGGVNSVSVMGSMHEVGYWEGAIGPDTPCKPQSFYGISKLALRQACQLLAAQTGAQLKWLRAYYITGDEARGQSVFAKLAQAAARGEHEFPFTSGTNQYDFIDVRELARQIVAASLQDEVDGVIECCTGEPLSLGDRMEAFIAERGFDIQLKRGAFPDRPYDSPGVWGDPSRIHAILDAEGSRAQEGGQR